MSTEGISRAFDALKRLVIPEGATRGQVLMRMFWIVSFLLGLVWTSLRFVVLPTVASGTIAYLADEYNMNISVEDWDIDVSDLTVVAHELDVLVDGTFDRDELLKVGELEVDLSLWRKIFHGQAIKQVTVRSPRLYIERPLTGRKTNWSQLGKLTPKIEAEVRRTRDIAEAEYRQSEEQRESEARREVVDAGKRFVVPRLKIEGLTIESVEKLPGYSGEGLIHEQKATLFIDDVEIVATDLTALLDPRDKPTSFQLEGRMADGKISLQADANFFRWRAREPQQGAQTADLRPAEFEVVWAPTLHGSLYLENIGAGTLARLVPKAAIQPRRGSLTGTVDFALVDETLDCTANLRLNEFRYAANGDAPVLSKRRGEVDRALAEYEVSGQRLVNCGGDLRNAEFRPLQVAQARTTREAVEGAPRVVQAAAVIDEARYGEVEVPEHLGNDVATLASADPNYDEFQFANNSFMRAFERRVNQVRRVGRRIFGGSGD